MRAKLLSVSLAFVVLLTCGVAWASILPGDVGQHWKLNSTGYSTLFFDDVKEVIYGMTIHKVTSAFQDFGNIGTGYADFGDDTGGGPNRPISGMIGIIVAGYQVIAVDDFTSGSGYDRVTGYTDMKNAIQNNLSLKDILYFGDYDGAAAYVYYDPAGSSGDFDKGGTFGTNSAGNPTYTDANTGKTIGDDLDEYLFKATFQYISGYQVDGTSRAAPDGTLFGQFFGQGYVQMYLNVVPNQGTSWQLIMPGKMRQQYVSYDDDANWIIEDDEPTKTVYADIIASAQTQNLPSSGWATSSDPIEWVSQPEPASVVIWAGLAGAAMGLAFLRRRAR